MSGLFDQLESSLAQAIKQKRVASAYLFLGPAGVGKFSFALRFSQSLLCETGILPACGRCKACKQVESLTHPDLHILEPNPDEKQIKIDQVRAFEQRLSFRAFQGGRKIGIIPEAERLTTQAMNALLKTLEEPPADTVLILTCSNRSRLLPTIVSRCQILRLGPVAKEKLVEILHKDHNVPLEKARLVANLAEGSLERAADLEHSVEQRKSFLQKWLELRSTNPGDIFEMIQDKNFSKNIDHYLNFLVDWYRDLIRVKLNQPPAFNLDFEFEIKAEALKYSINQLAAGLQLLLRMEQEMAIFNLNPATVGEQIFLQLR